MRAGSRTEPLIPLTVILGKSLPIVNTFATPETANRLPNARNTVPAMPKKTTSEILAENLRYLMQMDSHKDLNTDRKLGSKAGISHKTVNNILNGRHDVHLEKVEKIAGAFKLSVYQLLCPSPDRDFLTVCKVYSDADIDGRAFLLGAAEIVSRRTASGSERPATNPIKAKR